MKHNVRERQRKCGNRWRKKREQRKKEKEVKGMRREGRWWWGVAV